MTRTDSTSKLRLLLGIAFALVNVVAMDRRDLPRRQQVIRLVVDHLVHSIDRTVTIESLTDLLKIPEDGARRIVGSLVSAGILRQHSAGVWLSAFPMAGQQKRTLREE
jgi:hypothetical protein